jgi:GAF domain-containing protein
VQLQAATEVGRAATSILEVEELIWQVVELIQESFAFYHVGLFALDEAGEWAVYRAGAGLVGRKLWEQRFRLRVGGESMVGWCAAHGQPRIAQDVAEEKVRVRHDLVPETRSEVALPLIARGQVLGVLSVQSERTGTFDNATVAVLQTMADQVAVALDNARLFTESQQALETTHRAYGQLSHQAWIELLRSRTDWGYSFVHQSVTSIQGGWQPEMLEALRTRRAVVRGPTPLEAKSPTPLEEGDGAGGAALAVPLKVREDVIGVVGFYKDSADETWTPDEMQVLQRLVDQLGATLESAQLFRETQQRAAREQAIRQVTEQMRRAVDIEMILQSTVVELANALGAPRAYVRLGTEAELLGAQEPKPGDGHRPFTEPREEPAGRPMEVVSLGGDGKSD